MENQYESALATVLNNHNLYMERLSAINETAHSRLLLKIEHYDAQCEIANSTTPTDPALKEKEFAAKRALDAEYAIANTLITNSFKADIAEEAARLALTTSDPTLPSNITQEHQLQVATMMREGKRSIGELTIATGLPVYTIAKLIRSASFQQLAKEFNEQTDTRANDEARILTELNSSLDTVRFERAIAAHSKEELSDAEMTALGYNPGMRVPELANTPGSRTGLIKLTPITVTTVAGSRVRKTTQFVPELDTDLINAQAGLAKRLTELEATGQSVANQQSINTYVRIVNNPSKEITTNESATDTADTSN